MAKLDFFARYPDFFDMAKSTHDGFPIDPRGAIESAMVRHHYGPWDNRYYHVLAYLEARNLVTVTKSGRTYRMSLTKLGKQRAKTIEEQPAFLEITARMKEIKKAFGSRSGTYLKKLIYEIFKEEVADRPLGQVISK